MLHYECDALENYIVFGVTLSFLQCSVHVQNHLFFLGILTVAPIECIFLKHYTVVPLNWGMLEWDDSLYPMMFLVLS